MMVPAVANGHKFLNCRPYRAWDLAGVFIIETKTRRKGAARPGFDDHKVYFDGHVLVWPWGEDNHGLEQTERNAVWLADTLAAGDWRTVSRYPHPDLARLVGGDETVTLESRLCRVINPKSLPNFCPAVRLF